LSVRVIAVLLVVVGGLAALGFARHEERVREQGQLGTIASDLAGRTVGVRCPNVFASLVDVRGEAGRVQFDDAGQPTHVKGPVPPGNFSPFGIAVEIELIARVSG
jgi:hypothetical protein